MNCSEAKGQLELFADGELPSDVLSAVAEHVAVCGECARIVERWRALRAAVGRSMAADSPPAELRSLIERRLRPSHSPARRLIFRWGLSALSAAAVLVVLGWFWAGSTPVTFASTDFVAVHKKCAQLGHPHDAYGVGGLARTDAITRARKRAGFAAGLPDLTAEGYQLVGVCACNPQKGKARLLHAAYASVSGSSSLSLFSVDCPVELRACAGSSKCCGARRQFEQAAADDFTVVCWTEKSGGFALVGSISGDELVRIADRLDVAQINWSAPPVAAVSLP